MRGVKRREASAVIMFPQEADDKRPKQRTTSTSMPSREGEPGSVASGRCGGLNEGARLHQATPTSSRLTYGYPGWPCLFQRPISRHPIPSSTVAVVGGATVASADASEYRSKQGPAAGTEGDNSALCSG